MKIAIDVEETLAHIHKVWVEMVNTLYKTNFSFEDITDWYFKDTKFEQIGIEPNVFLDMIEKIWEERWYEIPPTEININKKIELLANVHRVDIVTQQNSNKVLQWLKKFSIPYNSFISIPLEESKSKLDYDVFIDDSPILAEELTLDKKLLLYDRPYNRKIKESKNIIRIYNFDQALKILL